MQPAAADAPLPASKAAPSARASAGPRRPPGPPGWRTPADTWEILFDPLGKLLRGHAEHGPIAGYRFGPQRYWMVSDLEAIRRILVENHKAYVKSPNYVGLRLVLGEGLVTSEGELWKRQRRLASPAFHPRAIESFVPTFARHTERMLARWAERPKGDVLDAHREMMALTLSIVGDCLFDTDLDGATERLGGAMETLIHFANDYAISWPKVPLWVPTPRHLAFQKALAVCDAAIAELIAARRAKIAAGESPGRDLLGAFLSARDEDGSTMSDRQLRDEVFTMLAAGHETTANALSFTLHLLSRHPDTERAVHAEVQRVLGDRPLEAADLSQLALTERVIKEAIRLYPPVWVLERQNVEPDVLGGYDLPAGTVIGISPWVLHRDPSLWENPEGFDPDRFLPERESARPRYAYLPFGAGPRICIGAAFAMTEAKALLALIVRRARLSAAVGRQLVLDPSLTLRPKHALSMTLAMRSAQRA
jgi:cytochrome P450